MGFVDRTFRTVKKMMTMMKMMMMVVRGRVRDGDGVR